MSQRGIVGLIEHPPFQLPLSLIEFERALRTGHGRALMHLRQFGGDGLLGALLHACANSVAYDAQIEADRAPWLCELMDAAELSEPILEHLIANASPHAGERGSWSLDQRLKILGRYARRGHDAAREAVFRSFAGDRSFDSPAAHVIVELEGWDGLIRVAREYGSRMRTSTHAAGSADVFHCQTYADRHGGAWADALRRLEAAGAADPNIAAYVAAARAELEPSADKRALGPRTIDMTIDEVRGRSNQAGRYVGGLRGWGMHAAEKDVTTVAEWLAQEWFPPRLERLLSVFLGRSWPPALPRFLELTRHSNPRIRECAWGAIAHVTHPDARSAAITALRQFADAETDRSNDATDSSPSGTALFDPSVLLVFSSNHEPGDGELIAAAIARALNRDLASAAHRDAYLYPMSRAIAKNPHADLLECALLVYEYIPCSCCRERVIEAMAPIVRLPEWVTEEFAFDCVPETRSIAPQLTK